jgi:hypothetical protein
MRAFLSKYSGDPQMAEDILEHSQGGNLLSYALQEHVVAHAVRAAGYDSVLSYSKHQGKPHLSELFHVGMSHYPDDTAEGWVLKALDAWDLEQLELAKAFNPDEPRDELGRWTDGGVANAGGPMNAAGFLRTETVQVGERGGKPQYREQVPQAVREKYPNRRRRRSDSPSTGDVGSLPATALVRDDGDVVFFRLAIVLPHNPLGSRNTSPFFAWNMSPPRCRVPRVSTTRPWPVRWV